MDVVVCRLVSSTAVTRMRRRPSRRGTRSSDRVHQRYERREKRGERVGNGKSPESEHAGDPLIVGPTSTCSFTCSALRTAKAPDEQHCNAAIASSAENEHRRFVSCSASSRNHRRRRRDYARPTYRRLRHVTNRHSFDWEPRRMAGPRDGR
ncbi:uncharacterized protein SPSK_02788 [Sporothrix schenckii 1099-18]|uniref:Uncharacterized protein n=1 Tax=Sporothrix schenckii 1099-18 TaxID=1397361 RepID=A0A0F2MF19_SPOSC|nr:uncharacterized protein SPSK_02788 [Sporothrix schenckii 1099-18]KJR86761.1 hypothetical protein SPSK_02788 [Sporothrix schenckii 1099-18]